ncbi:hypothetical protein ES708_22527 [subsurface metagenome]
MPEDKKRISPAVAIVGAGLGLGVLGVLALAAMARAAPPEEPEPGLANLYGKVTDSQTGAALPDVLVALDGMQTYTDSGGNYAFANLDPGEYMLQLSKEGYESAAY